MPSNDITTYNIRLSLKHDTETNWRAIEKTFKPMDGEMIIYSPDESHSYCRVKIGEDGVSLANLPFIDSGTINGHEVEIVKMTNFDARPIPGSPDKLYVDLSTNTIYHYDNNSGYTQLSNFTLATTDVGVSQINSWNAGSMTEASINNNTLIINNGTRPTLSHINVTALRSVQTEPNIYTG